jgi:hypothetical protein
MSDTSQIDSEYQVVANGLGLELPGNFDITYQIIPAYDDSENILAGWDDEELQYFMAFSKLPPGWLDANTWISGFSRDIQAASKSGTFKIKDKGVYPSNSGLKVSYIELTYTLKDDVDEQHQLASFITDNKNSYIAVATSASTNGSIKMLSEVPEILRSTSTPPMNVGHFQRKNENKYIGIWVGCYENVQKQRVDVAFELKADLTFTRRESVDGESDALYSGTWSISSSELSWTYLYGKPTTQGSKSSEVDEILSFDGENLLLASKVGSIKMSVQRANK